MISDKRDMPIRDRPILRFIVFMLLLLYLSWLFEGKIVFGRRSISSKNHSLYRTAARQCALLGRRLPMRSRAINGDFQYIADLQAKFLNVRCSAYSGHPSKLLRYFRGRSGNSPKLTVPRRLAKDSNAAEQDIRITQSVLPNTANTSNSPDTENPTSAGFLIMLNGQNVEFNSNCYAGGLYRCDTTSHPSSHMESNRRV